MNDIWQIIAKLGAEVHPDRINLLAKKIATLKSCDDFNKANFSHGIEKELINGLDKTWKKCKTFTPLELSAALRAASETANLIEKRESIEMVWTGPPTNLVSSRHTQQVLNEVILSAKKRLFLVSFVAYNIDTVIQKLQEVANKNIRVNILLELSKVDGGKASVNSINIFKKKLPSANLYTWKTKNGIVHAKCAVADGNVAFITSANLTTAAMEQNMEVGVLIRGNTFPNILEQHLESLITTEIIEKV